MSFAQDQGYVPNTIAGLMDLVRIGVNAQLGTSYDAETFLGTNLYKYFYALVQRLQENEVRTAEIVQKLQQYFVVTNERIVRPNTTHPGLVDYLAAAGYRASTKKPIDADAGKVYVALDLTDNHARGLITIASYANLLTGAADTITVGATVFTAQAGAATVGTGTFRAATSNTLTAESLAIQINGHATAGALVEAVADGETVRIRAKTGGTAGNSIALVYTNNDGNVGAAVSAATLAGGRALDEGEVDHNIKRLSINTLLSQSIPAGIVSQGTEVSTITMSNAQSFDFKFNLATRTAILLRLTITLSSNNQYTIPSTQTVGDLLYANVQARYRLGLNFEPQRYFSVLDAPWAASVLLEYSTNGGSSWSSSIAALAYDQLYTIDRADISIVEV